MSDWVRAYFDRDVGFEWNKIEGGSTPYPEPLLNYLQGFLQISRSNRELCVLPLIDGHRELELLIAAVAPEQTTELHNVANAYLGTAYARVASKILPRPWNSVAGAILEQCPGGIVRVVVTRQDDETGEQYRKRGYRVMALVLELIEQYLCRPPLLGNIRRPTGRTLRDLFTALRAGNAKSVWRYFDELRAHNALNARNLLFLEIQIHAGLGDWEAIVQHPRLEEMVRGRLPRRVSRALLEALGAHLLQIDSLSELEPEVLLEQLKPLQEYFTRKPDLDADDVHNWQIWVMGAALFGYLQWPESLADMLDQEWLTQLYKRLEIEQPVVSEPISWDPLDNLLSASLTLQAAVELLQFSLQANDAQLRCIAQHLSSFPAEVIQQIKETSTSRALWETLVGTGASEAGFDGWAAWFQRARQNPEDGLLQSALDCSAYWTASDWDEHALLRLAEDEQAIGLMRDLLPILMSWLDEQEIRLSLDSLAVLLDNLAIDDITSIEDLSLARDLLQKMLEQPHDVGIYKTMLDAVSAIWEKIKSINGMPGMFEVFDLLLDAPCADERYRQLLWQDLQVFLHNHWQRIDLETKFLARRFAEELLGNGESLTLGQGFSKQESMLEGIDMHGKKLGIYTLMQGAAQRAKSVLEQLYPGLIVQLNHDHESTPALVHLSQHADFFIFSSRTAKHQAFYAVTKWRRDIIYPEGKGSMSIIRAFDKEVQSRNIASD